eukprot:1157271-Pelagomonas_calceolata.AAC.8
MQAAINTNAPVLRPFIVCSIDPKAHLPQQVLRTHTLFWNAYAEEMHPRICYSDQQWPCGKCEGRFFPLIKCLKLAVACSQAVASGAVSSGGDIQMFIGEGANWLGSSTASSIQGAAKAPQILDHAELFHPFACFKYHFTHPQPGQSSRKRGQLAGHAPGEGHAVIHYGPWRCPAHPRRPPEGKGAVCDVHRATSHVPGGTSKQL